MEFQKETVQDLLKAYCEILRELRRRNLIRSTNNPVADIAETLVALALKLKLVEGSTAGYDAISASDGLRYQVKARRITSENKSRQLSFIRGLDKNQFDFLVGVLFGEDFQILKACVVPRSIVQKLAKYVKHVNGWRLILADSVWGEAGVTDMSEALRLLLGKLQTLPIS